jgi:hypothetical protein
VASQDPTGLSYFASGKTGAPESGPTATGDLTAKFGLNHCRLQSLLPRSVDLSASFPSPIDRVLSLPIYWGSITVEFYI